MRIRGCRIQRSLGPDCEGHPLRTDDFLPNSPSLRRRSAVPDTPTSRFIINADNKKRARLDYIAHLLKQIPYKDLTPIEMELPQRQPDAGYKRPKKSSQRWVPERY
jgi:hypothetical protein